MGHNPKGKHKSGIQPR